MRPFGDTLDNLVVENNVFGHVYRAGNTMVIGASASTDVCGGTNVVRYNTFAGGAGVQSCSTGSVSWTGNVVVGGCSLMHGSLDHNTFAGTGTCGTASKSCIPQFASTTHALGDWHLAATDTCARGAGNPANYPATDYEGDPRPQGAVDCGADELP